MNKGTRQKSCGDNAGSLWEAVKHQADLVLERCGAAVNANFGAAAAARAKEDGCRELCRARVRVVRLMTTSAKRKALEAAKANLEACEANYVKLRRLELEAHARRCMAEIASRMSEDEWEKLWYRCVSPKEG